ncbi:hypothetical protein E8E11_010110 [Didymella keratinophila]|nr:hypothetical protein E8E11_010110 [Didymella keratinophila]
MSGPRNTPVAHQTKSSAGSRNDNHHTRSASSALAAPVWTGGAGGGPAVVSAVEPAAVGRVAVEVVSGTDAEELTVEAPTEDASVVLEEEVGVISDDAAVDESSVGVLDVAALEDGTVTAPEEDATLDDVPTGNDDAAVLKDGRIELPSEDDNPGVLLEVGTTTMPVGVTDDSTEENREVFRENVGRAGDELMVVPIGTLADEDTRVDIGDEGTGTIMVAELEAVPLDPGAENVGATELEELAGTELEYCGGGTEMMTVVEDVAVELNPVLIPEAEGVTVGYTAELGMTGADRLDDTEDVEAKLGGSGTTTV